MSLRVFRDQKGEEWKVWDVNPSSPGFIPERRRGPRRGEPVARVEGGERRAGRDRRRNPTLFTPGLEEGWLCFENPVEKRRLTPIPPGWQEAPATALEELLREARRVARRLDPGAFGN